MPQTAPREREYMAEQSSPDKSIRGLFIPLAEDYTLLVPGSVVTEVVGFQEPVSIAGLGDESERWLLGRISWRDMELPLVSLEGFISGRPVEASVRSRIIVLKAIGNPPGMPYYGIVARQIPRLVTVQEGTIELLDQPDGLFAIQCQVLANGEPALIPDLARIEDSVYRALLEAD